MARVEADIHLLQSLRENRGAEIRIRARACAREIPESVGDLRGLGTDLWLLILPGIGNAFEHGEKTGAAKGVLRREVGAANERFEIGREPDAHRPAASARGRLHEGHIDAIDVGALLAVHFDVHEMVVHVRGDLRIAKGFALHHVTPVAGRITDREEDRLVFLAGLCERLRTPRIPVHRIMGVLEQVG